MKFISVQPDNLYFHWQVEVYLYNFIYKSDIKPSDIYVLFATTTNSYSKRIDSIIEMYPGVNILMYPDTREVPFYYISSIRPHILSKFFKDNYNLLDEWFFYHDSDILFTKNFSFNFEDIKSNVYLSNTRSYIGYDYIKSKGIDQMNEMFNIVGITEYDIIKNDVNSGGAQYVFNGLDYEFWDKVYIDSENLFKYLKLGNVGVSNHIQYWCSDMWSLLWNLILFNKTPIIDKQLDFCFATDNYDKIDDVMIFHNAGVIENNKGIFYKGMFIDREPYFEDFTKYNPNYSSYYYVRNIYEFLCNSNF